MYLEMNCVFVMHHLNDSSFLSALCRSARRWGGLAFARFTYKSEAFRLSGKIVRLSLSLINKFFLAARSPPLRRIRSLVLGLDLN